MSGIYYSGHESPVQSRIGVLCSGLGFWCVSRRVVGRWARGAGGLNRNLANLETRNSLFAPKFCFGSKQPAMI